LTQVQTSDGPAAAVAVSAETLTDADRAAIIAANTHNGEAPPPADPAAPDAGLIAGKFKTQEDFVAAYKALEAKNTQAAQAAAATAETPVDPTATPADPLTIDPATEVAGFDVFAQEFETTGALADESYAKLAEQGISREMVDTYIRGQESAASEYTGAVFAAAGDEARYGEITKWAASNLNAAEQAAFNAAVTSGNKEQAALATSGLAARYAQANGNAPRLLTGDSAGAAASDVFDNYSQVTAAMSSTEYKTDPAFRAKIDAKVGRSPNL